MRKSGLLSILSIVMIVAGSSAPWTPPMTDVMTVGKPGPVMQALIRDIEQVERKLLALSEAIPASSYGWRPAEGVRSVSEVVMHVAADNWFIPTAAGAAAPESTGITGDSYQTVQAYEQRTVTPEQGVAQMRESFAHLKRVMNGVDEATLSEPLDLFGQEMTGLELWVLTTTHLHEHLGQLIAYARTNGVVPPWSG